MRAFAVVAGLAFLPLCLQAQSSGLRDRDPMLTAAKNIASDLQRATFHIGPFYLLSRFQLSDIGFDQDYYFPTSETSEGIRISASAPQRLYFVAHKKAIFSLEATPVYSWGSDGDAASQFGYNTRADAQFLFNHLYLDLFVARSNDLRPNTGEINRLVTLDEQLAGLNGELKYSSRTSALFTLRFRQALYPEDRVQPTVFEIALLDRDERNARVALHHKTFPLTSLSVAAEHSDYDFRNASYKNSQRMYVGPGFNFDNGRMALRAEAGPARLRFDDPNQLDFEGILGHVELSRRARARWVIRGGASRDVDFAIMAGNNFYTVERAAASVEYAATRRLTLRANSQVGRDSFPVAVNGIKRRDVITFNSVGWIYTIRKFRGGFDVGYYDRSTNFEEADRQEGIRVVLNLSLSP